MIVDTHLDSSIVILGVSIYDLGKYDLYRGESSLHLYISTSIYSSIYQSLYIHHP